MTTRQAVIDEAKKWLGARWHHEACVPYYACDCGQIIADVYSQCGLIERPKIPTYPRQWALHQNEERYLAVVESYAQAVDTPQPADIAVWKIGRTYSHGAIVIDWPVIIHADIQDGVVQANAAIGPLAERAVKFYSVFGGEQ